MSMIRLKSLIENSEVLDEAFGIRNYPSKLGIPPVIGAPKKNQSPPIPQSQPQPQPQPQHANDLDKVVLPIIDKYNKRKVDIIGKAKIQLEKLVKGVPGARNDFKSMDWAMSEILEKYSNVVNESMISQRTSGITNIHSFLRKLSETMSNEWKNATREMMKSFKFIEQKGFPVDFFAKEIQLNKLGIGKFSEETMTKINSFYDDYFQIITFSNQHTGTPDMSQKHPAMSGFTVKYVTPAEKRANAKMLDDAYIKTLSDLQFTREKLLKGFYDIEHDSNSAKMFIKHIQDLDFKAPEKPDDTSESVKTSDDKSKPKGYRLEFFKEYPIQSNLAKNELIRINHLIAGYALAVSQYAGINLNIESLHPNQLFGYLIQMLKNPPSGLGLEHSDAIKTADRISVMYDHARRMKKALYDLQVIRKPKIKTDKNDNEDDYTTQTPDDENDYTTQAPTGGSVSVSIGK